MPVIANVEITPDRIHRVLRDGTVAERQEMVDALPAHPLKGTVRTLMASTSPGTPVAALAALAEQYCFGRHPAVGAPLAAGLHARGREILRTEPDHGLLSIAMTRLTLAHIKALALLARFEAPAPEGSASSA